jgi:hypothetical protein
VSAKESERVAKANAKTPSKRASQRGGAASSDANWKVPELRARAKKVGIKGPVSHEQEAARQGVAHQLERLPPAPGWTPASSP